MRQERLASLGAPRPCLLIAPALLIVANLGVASLPERVAPKPAPPTPAVARPHPVRSHGSAEPRSASPTPSNARQGLDRVPGLASSPPMRQGAFSDEAPKGMTSPEIRLIADSPTLPQVLDPPPPPPPDAQALPVESVWRALAICESGGNWQIDDGNGYYGGLQFDLLSWQEVGGDGYPSEHSPEVQIEMAERLQARQGWSAWPACSRVLGLE